MTIVGTTSSRPLHIDRDRVTVTIRLLHVQCITFHEPRMLSYVPEGKANYVLLPVNWSLTELSCQTSLARPQSSCIPGDVEIPISSRSIFLDPGQSKTRAARDGSPDASKRQNPLSAPPRTPSAAVHSGSGNHVELLFRTEVELERLAKGTRSGLEPKTPKESGLSSSLIFRTRRVDQGSGTRSYRRQRMKGSNANISHAKVREGVDAHDDSLGSFASISRSVPFKGLCSEANTWYIVTRGFVTGALILRRTRTGSGTLVAMGKM